MIYLILTVVCSSLIAVVFKIVEVKKLNAYAVTCVNYLIAFIASFFMALKSNVLKFSLIRELKELPQEFGNIFSGNSSILSQSASFNFAIIVGIMSGIFYFLAFIYYHKCIKENGVGISGTFSRLGILIPVFFSIILWKEYPTAFQYVGIIISIIAIILLNYSRDKGKHASQINLILLFIFGGMGDLGNKLFQKYALIEYKNLYLLAVFFTAFIISLYYTLKQRVRFSLSNSIAGVAVGIPNLFAIFFLILALKDIKASVAYPISSAGTIFLINLLGITIFKEKLSKRELFSIMLILISIIFMNI